MTDIEKLKGLLEKATPGPWAVQDGCSWRRIGTRDHDGDVLCPTNHHGDGHPDLVSWNGKTQENLALIVATVNALPVLLTELSSLRERVEAAEENAHLLSHELIETQLAHRRMLKSVLKAIDTGRSEPLFIVRDVIRNHLNDVDTLAYSPPQGEA